MRGTTLLALGFIASLAACGPQYSGADPAELIAADAAFAQDVRERGSEGWVHWFAADGAIVREGEGVIRGTEALRSAVAFLDQPGVSLQWTPTRADIAESGDLGWTTGGFVSEATAPDGTVTRAEGVYVSIWRRQADGSWRVVMDLGNPT